MTCTYTKKYYFIKNPYYVCIRMKLARIVHFKNYVQMLYYIIQKLCFSEKKLKIFICCYAVIKIIYTNRVSLKTWKLSRTCIIL